MFKYWTEVYVVTIITILFFLVLAFRANAQDTIDGDISRLSIHVTDGDTFRIKNPKELSGTLDIEKHQNKRGELEIRIQGIDAPENKQACFRGALPFDCGGDAKRELTRLLSAGSLYCVKSGTSYNRVVMRCSVDDKSVGVSMVQNGFAFFDPNPMYTKGIYRLQLRAAENIAWVNRSGVWDQAEIVKPWDWRKLH